MIQIALHEKVKSLGIYWDNVVNDVPEDAFNARRRGKTASVNPPFLKVNSFKKFLEINWLIFISTLIFYYAFHKSLHEIHVIFLFLINEIHVFRNIKENSGNCISPVFKQIFLIFLNIHQFVNNVQLKVKFSIVYCVFAR